jgi:hypothetical protein
VGVLQNPAGLLQPGQERGPTPGPPAGNQALGAGDCLRPLGEVLDAEQLTANRTGEQVLADVGSKERGEDGEGTARRWAGDGRLAMGLWAIR